MQPGIDTLLMRGGQPNWDSDKTSRRALIAKSYRILMLLGDSAGDFAQLLRSTPFDAIAPAQPRLE